MSHFLSVSISMLKHVNLAQHKHNSTKKTLKLLKKQILRSWQKKIIKLIAKNKNKLFIISISAKANLQG
jgi:hypothetical protein